MAAEGLEKLTEVPVEFFKDGAAFVQKCTKPDKRGECDLHLHGHSHWNTNNVLEYLKIIRAVGVGFIMMGVVGYAIKLVCFTYSMESL
jgi:protein transport protein SEC61 subunit gamma-like protein